MEYLLEITRIVDGAVKGDHAKVAAYVEQLARKLVEAGETQAADRLLRTLRKEMVSEVALQWPRMDLKIYREGHTPA